MSTISNHTNKLYLGWYISIRRYSSSEPISEISDVTKKIYKLMMSTPAVTLDTALNQNGIRVSPEIVENVLKKFENAGMVAYRFFEWAEKQRHYTHSIRAYQTMIESLGKIRQYQIMWDVVNAMRSKRMLNVETFCIIMRQYARAQKLEEAVYTFNVMDKHGVPPNLAAFNGLLSALCKSKNVRKAQEIFDSMKDQFVPDSKTFSILIEGWGKAPNLPKAREIFRKMVDMGCSPDIVTYGIMVDILCKAGRVDEALSIVGKMDSTVCKPTSFIYSILVHTYGIENRIEDAVDTFLRMEKNGIMPDVAVYNALIGAFCKANKFKNVYRVLNDMDCKGVKPNSRTFNIILSNLIGYGATDEAFKVFRKMIKVCMPDADTYTMMIKMFCEKNNLEMALNMWKYMKKQEFVPSMHTFSVLINGLCEKGDASQACVLFEEMIEKGIRPSGVTFGRLRHLLIKEGREDVVKFLQEKVNVLVKEPLWD
ncbi:pentatricopeptide repeat-containing protein At1g77360, mitochondrial [Jatropha curcas]|nr:pentatricopeptide repeat-containing protein At1g77360, mitochondrial [Jatropha curcas]XP_020536934.1 pentatricopeptide repeat-containing protein At1g77360, mitochondrial [Jatropha curcas]XP_020536935.1 pentatricopeptide repeat-containing protein At1g77360, mitochondrial [Jatropha curcas]